MADLRNHRLIIAKGFLFLSLGVLASAILLMLAPRLEIAVLLAILSRSKTKRMSWSQS